MFYSKLPLQYIGDLLLLLLLTKVTEEVVTENGHEEKMIWFLSVNHLVVKRIQNDQFVICLVDLNLLSNSKGLFFSSG
jgi:hypothetical protein